MKNDSRQTGRNKFAKYKSIIHLIELIVKLLPANIRRGLYSMVSNIRGNIGALMRFVLIRTIAMKCGDNVLIRENVIIKHIENISFGDNVSIHQFCYIDAEGGLNIGSNVSIAHATSILTSNHTYSDLNTPIKYQPMKLSSCFIKDDVWIGCGCRILAGTTLESRTIVAAGAVVNSSFDRGSIIGGIPSKVLKNIN